MTSLPTKIGAALGLAALLAVTACDEAPSATPSSGGDVADAATDMDGSGDTSPVDTDLDRGADDTVDEESDDVEADRADAPEDAAQDPEADAADTADTTEDVQDALDSGPDAADLEDDEAEEVCPTSVCGPEDTCCPVDTECVLDACLPVCPSGVRCGEGLTICCEVGTVCLEQTCTPPGDACLDSYDCPEGEFCEPTLGRCLPQPEDLSCQVVPDFDEIEVDIEWSLDNEEIISIPLVGDLDGDDLPEVVIDISRVGGDWPLGEIAILEGEDGSLVRRVTHDPDAAEPSYGSHGRSTAAIGDLTGDGLPDIVYAGRRESGQLSPIHAVDGNGDWLFTAYDGDGATVLMQVENGAATLANFDDDPQTEIVFGASLIDHTGLVVWNEGGNGAAVGSNAGYMGGISAVADLDDDGAPEIVSGRQAWTVVWTPGDPPSASVTNAWPEGDPGDDGYPAVADLDGDGTPEVVLVANRTVQVLDGLTGKLWCGRDPTGAACDGTPANRTQPLTLEGGTTSNRGGPPTIADFDDDGRPEIGIAGGWAYTVYDVNRPGETIVKPPGDPEPDPGAIYVRWTQTTQDFSSNATGSSVFDFQGDGAAEVVYADECYMRVYSGTDGQIQLEIPSSTATIHEYPLVVDIDGDNNSEIVIVANIANSATNCDIEGYVPRQGIYVYGAPGDDWVRTRRVWTQHTYHVTNATSTGDVPFEEADNWRVPGLNNYRQNVQGEGVFNAPDLTVELSASLVRCDEDLLRLLARVANQGSLGVPAGLEVSFFEGTDETGTLLGTATTEIDLLPGAATTVILDVPAPPPISVTNYFVTVSGVGVGVGVECDSDNNSNHLPWSLGCPKG